jgi:predicted dehydrogenase
MKRKKIGLMGCGMVAGYGHLPALRDNEDLELHSLFDPDGKALKARQDEFAVSHAFTDQTQFLESGIDAVVITSPAPVHLDNLRAAAAHGLHVLCEKPLAMAEVDSVEMIRLAAEADIMLFTGFDYRFSPVSQQIRQLVQGGAVGDVRSLRLIYVWNCHGKYVTNADGHRVEQARRAGRMLEGGPMVDCGVHQIDLARWWLGSEVQSWTAAGAWVEEYKAPDHMYVHMDHDCGAHTMVEISYSYCHTAAEPFDHFTYQLIGTEGLIRYERSGHLLEVRDTRGTRQLPSGGEKNFDGMYAAFARALRQGGSDELPSGEDGLAATRIAREATEHVISQRPSSSSTGPAR